MSSVQQLLSASRPAAPKGAWRLTADGEAVIDAHKPLKQAQRRAGRGGKLATTRSNAGRRGKTQQPASTDAIPVAGAAFRMTALTHEVLSTIATLNQRGSSPSNRQLAVAVNVKDEGQISKLLHRLQAHGLLGNTGGGHRAAGNAWQLTPRGEELLSASRPAAAKRSPASKRQAR